MFIEINDDVHRRLEELMLHCFRDEIDPSHSAFLSILLDCYENSYMKSDRQSESNNNNNSQVFCPECDDHCVSVDSLIRHFTEIHHNCEKICSCGLKFEEVDTYLKHNIDCQAESKSSAQMTFTCSSCEKEFKSQPLLDQHMHLHYPPQYKCDWCGNMYRWPPVFYHHKQKCRHRPEMEVVQPHSDFVTEPISDESDFHFDDQSSLIAKNFLALVNLLSMSNSIANTQQQMNNQLAAQKCACSGHAEAPCSSCSQEHSDGVIHDLSINNKKCEEFFYNAETAQNQPNQFLKSSDKNLARLDTTLNYTSRLSGPNNTKKFFCRLCSKEFTSKLSIKQHIDGKHTSQGKYVCGSCGKRYRWGASFYYHRRTCGNNEFTRKISLNTSSSINLPPQFALT